MNNDAWQFLDIQIKTKFQGLANHSTTTKLIISRYTEHAKFQCKFTTKNGKSNHFMPEKPPLIVILTVLIEDLTNLNNPIRDF